MSTAPTNQKFDNPVVLDDIKTDIDHVDEGGRDVRQRKSNLDTLSITASLKTFKRAVLLCTLIGFTAACDGYQFKLSANIIANRGFIQQFAEDGRRLNPTHVSVLGGLTSAGLVLGQLLIARINDWFGRRGGAIAFLLLLLLGAIIEAVARQWWHWVIAKVFAGAGVGACQATLPVFIGEHSPARIRGSLIVAYSMWFALGQLAASIALKARADVAPLDYLTPIYTQFGMIGVALIITFFVPESPWWLVRKGKLDKARKVLAFVNKGVPGYNLEEEIAVMSHTIEAESEKRSAKISQFAVFKGLNLKRFFIGAWPKILQQFVGLSIFSNYSAYFFQLAGNSDPFMVTVILGVVGVVAILIDSMLVDRLGRRIMTMLGFGGACFGVTLMSIIGCFDYASKALGAVLVFAGVTASFFNSLQSSTGYAYLTELPELHFKASAIGWGLAVCNVIAIAFSFLVPIMLDAWQVKAAFVFVGLGVPGTILAWFIMPESTSRSPAEIQELFVDRVPLRRWKGYVTSVEREMTSASA